MLNKDQGSQLVRPSPMRAMTQNQSKVVAARLNAMKFKSAADLVEQKDQRRR
jgi:hypothetical protein